MRFHCKRCKHTDIGRHSAYYKKMAISRSVYYHKVSHKLSLRKMQAHRQAGMQASTQAGRDAGKQQASTQERSNTLVPCMTSFHWASATRPLLSLPDLHSSITAPLSLSKSAVEHLWQSNKRFMSQETGCRNPERAVAHVHHCLLL